MVSEAQKRATTRFEHKTYDKVTLRLRKDGDITRDMIQDAADTMGLSVNAFIMEALKEKMGLK